MEKQDLEEVNEKIKPKQVLLESEKKEAFLIEFEKLCEKHEYTLYPVLQVIKQPKIKEKIVHAKKSTHN